jgi:prevent-host-death family protein
MERELGITKAREEFSSIVEQVQFKGDTFIISRHGKPAAAVVPVHVFEGWKRQRRELFDRIREMQQEADLEPEAAESISAEAVAAARAESQATE